jgi:hypothetical protein
VDELREAGPDPNPSDYIGMLMQQSPDLSRTMHSVSFSFIITLVFHVVVVFVVALFGWLVGYYFEAF